MATARESTNFANLYTNKYLSDIVRGRVFPLYMEATVVSVSATGDSYKLTRIPAYARVVGLEFSTNGLAASAGVGVTVKLGDSGDDDRYMAATDFDLVNASGVLAYAGHGYTPTSDTDVLATITGTAIVGRLLKGTLFVVPKV